MCPVTHLVDVYLLLILNSNEPLEERIYFIVILLIIQDVLLTFDKSISGSEGFHFLNTLVSFHHIKGEGHSEDYQYQHANDNHGSNTVESGLVRFVFYFLHSDFIFLVLPRQLGDSDGGSLSLSLRVLTVRDRLETDSLGVSQTPPVHHQDRQLAEPLSEGRAELQAGLHHLVGQETEHAGLVQPRHQVDQAGVVRLLGDTPGEETVLLADTPQLTLLLSVRVTGGPTSTSTEPLVLTDLPEGTLSEAADLQTALQLLRADSGTASLTGGRLQVGLQQPLQQGGAPLHLDQADHHQDC